MSEFTTKGRITILLGKYQLTTGQRLSPRRLAQLADVPKDLVYRLDAGLARYVDLQPWPACAMYSIAGLKKFWCGKTVKMPPLNKVETE